MKIILSRKGFDTATGGKPSPILDNKFISLPIPETGSGIFYRDLIVSEGFTYEQLMHDLSITDFQEAHQDPDLRSSMSSRHPDWQPLFGQNGSAQGLLNNSKVETGDLFLFFGYFKKARRTDNGVRYIHNSKKIHAIFGYLQVERIIDISTESILPWIAYHPHVALKTKYQGQRNVLYVAKKNLSFNPKLPGAGCFEYHKKLVLTAERGNMSDWELPCCFRNEEKNFNIGVKIRPLENGNLHVQTRGQGQEIFISSKPEIVEWAQDLISKSKIFF
ncbi:MAG: hypothetical protein ACM3YE_11915 [Bacteroidota bacterium]